MSDPTTDPAPPPPTPADPPRQLVVIVFADDGFAEATICGQQKRIDVYRVYNLMQDAADRAFKEQPEPDAVALRQVAFLDRAAEVLAGVGFIGLSHRAADKFDTALDEVVEALKKADGSGRTPDSPAPTAPTS